jgi:hypothetical protein
MLQFVTEGHLLHCAREWHQEKFYFDQEADQSSRLRMNIGWWCFISGRLWESAGWMDESIKRRGMLVESIERRWRSGGSSEIKESIWFVRYISIFKCKIDANKRLWVSYLTFRMKIWCRQTGFRVHQNQCIFSKRFSPISLIGMNEIKHLSITDIQIRFILFKTFSLNIQLFKIALFLREAVNAPAWSVHFTFGHSVTKIKGIISENYLNTASLIFKTVLRN